MAYGEVHGVEKAATRVASCAGRRLLTDNTWTYRTSTPWKQALADLAAPPTPTPQTNGVEPRQSWPEPQGAVGFGRGRPSGPDVAP